MFSTQKILIISDDEENISANHFRKILDKDKYDDIELFCSKSGLDDLKMNMRRDFYVILIDYDNLDGDINHLIGLIRSYLSSLPLIVVLSYDTSIFSRKIIPHVTFHDKSKSFETVYNQLVNFIKSMEFCKSINDVSHLPGNIVINQVMENKLKNNEDFVIMYIDIDKFKPFTDYFGIFRSSQVIKYLARLVIDLIEKYGLPEDFAGHVGGDDFVVIFNSHDNYKLIGDKIVEEFDKNIQRFYDEIDVQRGYIEVLNRESQLEKFPFITLSIVSISNELKDYSTTEEIYKDFMIYKKEAKQTMGSILLHSADMGGV